ncbi:hypothetical protein [Promicromonospora panici]|uniref:hypothetical protein n=1 Tax=Promicromonospora panici TaxID=2219658 RepID=UPI001A921AFA|nr:hypothetical protein [Promicromonospora panici]
MITALRRPWGKRAMALVTAVTLALPVAGAAAVPATAAPAPTVAAAPEAPAAPTGIGCGERIVHKGIHAGGRRVAWLDVYYNRSTDAKCAVTVHTGPSWGVTANTAVRMTSGRLMSGTSGTYAYRTDRVVFSNVDGVCVAAQGGIYWRGDWRTTTVRGLCG